MHEPPETLAFRPFKELMNVIQFEKIGLFLNDEPGDQEALAFTAMLARMVNPQLVVCIHVRGLEEPAHAPSPTQEEIHERVRKALPEDVALKTSVEVHEETGLTELLRSARDKELDLVIVGRRLPGDGRAAGSTFLRLARKAPCSVLVVPDRARLHLGRALVLVDESEHARLALETALAIVRVDPGERPEVIAQCVYTVDYGYRYAGLSFSEAVANLEKITRERLQPMIDAVDTTGVEFELVLTYSQHVSQAAYDLASARNMDFIVVGSRGAHTAPATLMGGVEERVLAGSPDPVLVVKKKGETVRFLDALLSRT
jgi:nucleotide-binding universal stress UspA family protein